MADLERLLREARPDWPPTPDLAGAVAARIAAEPVRRRRPRRGRLRAFLAALLVAFGATLAISPARGALLDLLGLGGVEVQRKSPSATPAPAPPSGERLGQGLSLGTAVTPAQAARLARGFAAAPPAGLGRPDATFFAAGPPESGRVSYVYRARRGLPKAAQTGAGLLVTEMRAQVTPFAQKAVGPGTTLTRLRVDGDPALYLGGRPHGFAYGSPGGTVAFEEQRLAAPTLLVQRSDGVLIRVEGRVSRARAVRIAGSVPR